MTSRHYFFSMMKEDFRHKVWMLALSILGNLLALPVVFLIYAGDNYSYYDTVAAGLLRAAGTTVGFFSTTMCITAGIIAIVGACIVGLASFRYVFHRNMVDTYHSIPVKRRTLFAVSWLNGFLIWLVPFFANLVITMFLGVGRLNRLKSAFSLATDRTPEMTEAFSKFTSWDIFKEGLLSATALVVVFLLVYHLILVAVMFCGNVLNTLVMTGVAGAGAISLYVLWVCFEDYYLDTFLTNLTSVYEKLIYASPLVSAVYTLVARVREHSEDVGAGTWILVNLVIATLLGVLAAYAYEKRPSELAEQGVKNKPLKFMAQVAAAIGAGMGGWLLLYAISDDISGQKSACAWGVFGCLLAAVLVFGVMDIIFRMDFKAFFAHKALMAVTSAAVLLLCFGFCFDWVGYDTYLPEKDRIVAISVFAPNRNILHSYSGKEIERVTLTDTDKIYEFLENAVSHYRTETPDSSEEAIGNRTGELPYRTETIEVKVTLDSGRSYYREYRVYSYDYEPALAILTSEEYMNAFFRISESDLESVTGIRLERNGHTAILQKSQNITEEKIRKICDAYNQDLKEQPEIFICGGGRVLATMTLEDNTYRSGYRYLTVYEDMKHTREALEECGYGLFAEPIAAEDVEEIRIESNVWISELKEGNIDLLERVRDQYAVYGTEGTMEGNSSQSVMDEKIMAPQATVESWTDGEADEAVYVSVTDEAEMKELLELLSYCYDYHSTGAFQRELVGDIQIITKDRNAVYAHIYEGALPEKYVLRFQE